MSEVLELVKIDPKEFGLTETTAQGIQAQFEPMLQKMVELEDEYNQVVSLPTEDPKTSAKAKELRLKYVKVRTGTAEIHKTQKAFYLNGGRFVDGWKNAQLFASQGKEEQLEKIEKYYENIEKERLQKLNIERTELIQPYLEAPSTINYSLMEEDVWSAFLLGAKTNYNNKKEAERIAEEQRLERERIESEQRETQRLENERLKAEAEKREKEIEAERIANEKKLAEERAKVKAEAERIEEENRKRLKAELEAKAKIEAELKAKIEAEKKAEQEKAAAELKAKKEAEKLAKAPIKKQLVIWVDNFSIETTNINNNTVLLIQEKFEAFKKWAKEQVENV